MKRFSKTLQWLAAGLALAALAVLISQRPHSARVVDVKLSDGRTVHIERIAFGKEDRVGQPDYFGRYLSWAPRRLLDFFAPKKGLSELSLTRPALVVWMDATETATGKNIDCQNVSVGIVDHQGELWSQTSSASDGFGGGYSRVARVFECFPRDEPTFTLRLKSQKVKESIDIEVANPHVTTAANWSGQPLPQRCATNGFEIELAKLRVETNANWGTLPVGYWNPDWRLLRDGTPASGWDGPEWEAEDPLGNRGQFPNINQPALRFDVAWYPSPTNLSAAVVVATLPVINLSSPATNLWNLTNQFKSQPIFAMGYFPPGVYVFTNGQFSATNPGLTRVNGGAPSGWTGWGEYRHGRNLWFYGHYTPSPVIYLRYDGGPETRLALRLRDDQGHYWLATPEEQNGPDGIHPFMLKVPPEVKTATPEIVILPPLKATFVVQPPSRK